MTIKQQIENYLVNTERSFATVRDWGKDSVNGYLKIDMGKYAVFKELKRKIKASDASIYKAIHELEKERILRIDTRRPMMVSLMEKHLLCVMDETLKY